MKTNACAKSKRKRILIKILILAVVLLLIFVLIFSHFKSNVLPIVVNMSEAKVKAMAVHAVNNAAYAVLDNSFTYDNLVTILRDSDDKIQMIQTNTLLINQVTRELAMVAQSNVELIKEQTLQLPIGAFTGSVVLSGLGPKINLALLPVGSVQAEVVSIFESAGINQTRHGIYINLNTTINIVLPVTNVPVETTTSILVCESIIVGEVPAVYFNNSGSSMGMIDLNP